MRRGTVYNSHNSLLHNKGVIALWCTYFLSRAQVSYLRLYTLKKSFCSYAEAKV